jgi:hypothetical protein
VYPYLFPDSLHFARYLARRGVRLMFNHHHAAGVQFHETVFPAFSRAIGQDPAAGKTIEFDIANRTWADIYFREVIKPLEDVGVNLDWEDFQQTPVVRARGVAVWCSWGWGGASPCSVPSLARDGASLASMLSRAEAPNNVRLFEPSLLRPTCRRVCLC